MEINIFIKRQLQIALILNTPNSIIDWFNEFWSTLNVVEVNVYHKKGGELIYYIIDNETKRAIFYRNDDRNIFTYDYSLYCVLLNKEISSYNINYKHKQPIITKTLIENKVNTNIGNPEVKFISQLGRIHNAINK